MTHPHHTFTFAIVVCRDRAWADRMITKFSTLQSALDAFPAHDPPGLYIGVMGVEGYPHKIWEPATADLAEIAKWL